MSGGYYRLIRTDSQDGDDSERSRPWKEPSTIAHTLLFRLFAAINPSKHGVDPLLTPRRLSRDSSSSSASSILSRNVIGRRRPQLLLFSSIFFGLLVTVAIFGAHWDKVESFYYVQFLMTTPSNACLVDRSSPASYVHWNPKSNTEGSIYHCITQRIPQYSNHTSPMPVGSSIRPYRPLPASCIDSYYTNGTSCSDQQRTTFDIIWTWVNGSDPMITRARAKALKALSSESEDDEDSDSDDEEDDEEEEITAHLYRDHDELRHSLRSVLQYFRESANKFIILTSDFDFPVTYSPFKYLLGLSKRSNVRNRSLRPGKRRTIARRDVEEYEEDIIDDEDEFAFARLGLLPQWLKFNLDEEDLEYDEGDAPFRYDADKRKQGIGRWKDGNISLEVVHHAEVYDEYEGTVFNSNSIESQLGNLGGNKAFIYFNDDCFFSAPLSSADFHTSHFGLVFRLIAYPFNLVNPHHFPVDSPLGEWHPMEFTNYIISERFGLRRRPYPMHQVKVLQGGLMREMWSMWRDQEDFNRGHKFRGLGGLNEALGNHTWADDIDPLEQAEPLEDDEEDEGEIVDSLTRRLGGMIKRGEAGMDDASSKADSHPRPEDPSLDEMEEDLPKATNVPQDDGDAHVMFLFTHFIVERSREGMLWSWIVGSLGGDNDEFGISQQNEAWRVLTESAQAEQLGRGVLEVLVEKRKTMEPWRVQWALDEVADTLKASKYRFSSQDGYAYSYYDDEHGLEWWHDGSTYWPLLFDDDNFRPEVAARPSWSRCTIEWNTCFPSEMTSASDMFKHVAFEQARCGDCILKALVRASGDLGLSAVLPPPGRVHRRNTTEGSRIPPNPVGVGEDDVPPHLPLTPQWQDADFSLAGVFASGFWGQEQGGVNLRDWVQRMLERYRYVIADTDNYFNVVHNPVDAEKTFAFVDDHPSVSLVTINDDVQEYPEQTDARMREWFEQRWPNPAEWENPSLKSQASRPFDSIRKRSIPRER